MAFTSSINEVRREREAHVSELGLRYRAGVRNIKAVYGAATQAERDYWGHWYYAAHHDVKALASVHGIDHGVAAAVVATLSPGSKWTHNLAVADEVITRWKAGRPLTGLASYPDNIVKARRILDTNSTTVTGPKVSVFHQSLLDPKSVAHRTVVDGHAINILYGRKVSLKEAPSIGKAERAKIEAAYRQAADELRISPQALQATTWYVWKYTSAGPKPKPRAKVAPAVQPRRTGPRGGRYVVTESGKKHYDGDTSRLLDPGA